MKADNYVPNNKKNSSLAKTLNQLSVEYEKTIVTKRYHYEAQKQVLFSAVKENKLEFIKLLQRSGIDIDSTDNQGKTVLMWASKLGHTKIIKFLLKHNANFNARDCSGMTAVHEAAFRGQIESLKLLAESGADLDETTDGGQTPLHFAVNGHLEVTRYLLDKGGEPLAKDNNNMGILHWAITGNNTEIIKLIIKRIGKDALNNSELFFPPIFIATQVGNVQTVKYLLKKGSQINDTLDDGSSLLHIAVVYDRVDMINFLLEQGMYIDIRDGDGWTPLHIASSRGYLDTAKLLLSAGADINAKSNKGSTPLKVAIVNEWEDLIQFLVQNEADINATDFDGRTILDTATKQNDLSIAVYLADKGADLISNVRESLIPKDASTTLIDTILTKETQLLNEDTDAKQIE